jgi:hypothetical protein
MLPLSISFTGLAWHAPISIGIGLWALPEILSRCPRLLFPAAIGIGWFFGAWGINWIANEAEYHASIPEFVLFAAATTGLLILALAVFTALRRSAIVVHSWEGALLAGLAAFFFIFRVIAQPVAALVLPLLLGITFFALWNNRRKEAAGMLAEPLPPVPARAFVALPVIALAAASVYASVVWAGAKIQTNILFYLLLTPLGFILYFGSLWRIFADRRNPT